MDDEDDKDITTIIHFPYRHEVHIHFSIYDIHESPTFSYEADQKTDCHVFETKWKISIKFQKVFPTEALTINIRVKRIDGEKWAVNANCSIEVFGDSMKPLCPLLRISTAEVLSSEEIYRNFKEAISNDSIVPLLNKNLKGKFVLQVGSCHLIGNEKDVGLNQMYYNKALWEF